MSTKIDDTTVRFRPAYRLLGLPSVHEVSFPECDTDRMDEALDEARNFARVAYADSLKMGIRPTGVSVIIHTVESFTQTKTIHSAAYGYYSHDDVSGYKYNEQMKDGKTIYKQGTKKQVEAGLDELSGLRRNADTGQIELDQYRKDLEHGSGFAKGKRSTSGLVGSVLRSFSRAWGCCLDVGHNAKRLALRQRK